MTADASEAREAGTHAAEHEEHEAHASRRFYWMIGGILAVLTAMEVAAFYMELGAIEAPFLIALSLGKFVLVVMFYMHLKFDSKIFTGLFAAGMVLATFMTVGMWVLYHVLPGHQ